MFDKFTTPSRQIVINAQNAAKADSVSVITSMHLLRACVGYGGNIAKAFEQSHINTQMLKQASDEFLELQRIVSQRTVDAPSFSADAKHVLEAALKIRSDIGVVSVEPWMMAVAALSIQDVQVVLDLSNSELNELIALCDMTNDPTTFNSRRRKDQAIRKQITQLTDAIAVMQQQADILRRSLSDGGSSKMV